MSAYFCAGANCAEDCRERVEKGDGRMNDITIILLDIITIVFYVVAIVGIIGTGVLFIALIIKLIREL